MKAQHPGKVRVIFQQSSNPNSSDIASAIEQFKQAIWAYTYGHTGIEEVNIKAEEAIIMADACRCPLCKGKGCLACQNFGYYPDEASKHLFCDEIEENHWVAKGEHHG